MANLNENQKSFIRLMNKSEEHARRGFDLLAKRQDADQFFDELAEQGLLDPDRNPGPVYVDDKSIRVPQWPALWYLAACAKASAERGDNALASKVMAVIRSVSTFTNEDGSVRDNFRTFQRFAEILGTVPKDVITNADLDLVSTWLNTRFDRDLVAHALDQGAIKRFLASDAPDDWQKATRLLHSCLAIRWQRDKRDTGDEEPVTVVDPYWLQELIGHHAAELGKKDGPGVAAIFCAAVRELFSKGDRASWSYIFRPSVESHAQNHSWRSADNCFVDGLRDVLLSWSEVDPPTARAFVSELLHSDVEMLRRIGIFMLGKHWNAFSELYAGIVGPDLFQSGHIHELFHVLKDHFEQFEPKDKAQTITAIRRIPAPEGEDAANRLKRIQRRWLEAIAGTTFEPAVTWLAEFARDPLTGVQSHPDFNSYIETSWGHGPSPYQIQELVAFAEGGTIVEKLQAFKPKHEWRGPSSAALVETLQQAVMAAPMPFTRALPTFLDVMPTYQHGVIAGFKRLWDAPKDQQSSADWDHMWPSLLTFFEKLFENPTAGARAPGNDDFTPNWLLAAVADLLHAGTRDDDHAYSAELLPRGWALLEVLVDRAEASQQADDRDPMTAALNTPKGRTLEAIFSHALREARLADTQSNSHATAWERLRPRFDRELKKCDAGNYEFSTLAAAYIANLEYLDPEWLREHLTRIFPVERPANFSCALSGLAYSAATRSSYVRLRDAGVMDAGLRLQLKGRDTRKMLIERVLLAYLWDEEALDSPRVSYLFESAGSEDLEAAAWFFWTVRDPQLSPAQIAKVVAFWERCVTWAQGLPTPPDKLLSTLAMLTWSLADADGKHGELLMAVAPYAGIGHSLHEFLNELIRLVEISPAAIAGVLGEMIKTYKQTYDYENVMKTLITRLADLGQRPLALKYCDQLRDVDGIPELFTKLRNAGA